jgi:hypothetical protein
MHGTHCLGNSLCGTCRRRPLSLRNGRMFKKARSTVKDKGGKLFFSRIVSKLVCFSGQPAQLTAASAAGFKLSADIITVHNEQFACRLTAGWRCQDRRKEQENDKKNQVILLLVLHGFLLFVVKFFAI